jgi:5-methylcytosine-specific restriction endonuclease McrA
MSTYAELLKDPRWQRKRLEILNRDEWMCMCGDTTTTLHVHHRYYVKGRDPWEYPDFCYVTLCETCHGALHGPGPFEELSFESAAMRGFRLPADIYITLGAIGPIV